MACTHAILDLACRREYIKPLMDELKQVCAEDGTETDEDGYIRLKKESYNKLRKMDSFMKESQRFSPPIYSTFNFSRSTSHIAADIPTSVRNSHPHFRHSAVYGRQVPQGNPHLLPLVRRAH